MIFARFFQIFLKKYLSMKSLLLCLLLLPILSAVAVISLQSPSTATGMVAGILAQSDTPYATAVVETLSQREDVTFTPYTDLDALTADVAQGDIVAGYVLGEDFDSRVSALQTEDLVQLIKLEDDIYHSYLNEVVYAAVYAQLVPHITQEFLLTREIEAGVEEILPAAQGYLDGDVLFTMEMISVLALQSGESAPSPLPLVRGVLAVGLLTLTLLATAACAQIQQGWALFTPYLRRIQLDFYALSPIYVLGVVAGGFALCVASLLSSYDVSLVTELGRLAVYQLMLFAIALILPRLIGRETIVLLIPFMLLFVVVTHPIFFDITAFFPSWDSWLRYLPSYWYLG